MLAFLRGHSPFTVEKFHYFALTLKEAAKSYSRLDKEVADHINHLYQECAALTRAGWLLSGIKRLYPRMRKELAVSQQWKNNWCRQHTPTRAPPITWKIVQAIAGVCFHQHWYQLAILFLVGFALFLRTQELLELTPLDFKIDLKWLVEPSRSALPLRRPHKTLNSVWQCVIMPWQVSFPFVRSYGPFRLLIFETLCPGLRTD